MLLRVQKSSLQLKAHALVQTFQVVFSPACKLKSICLCCGQECRAAECSLQAGA